MGTEVTVTVFEDGSRGIGHSLRVPGTVHYASSFDCRTPGQAVPAFKHVLVDTDTQVASDYDNMRSVAWTDTTGDFILFSAGASILKIQAGVEGADLSGAFNFTGSAMHEDGLGTAYWYVGAGTAENIRRRTVAGVWEQATEAVKATLLRSINGELYRTLGHYIYKCPETTNPFVLTNWGAAEPVGTPQYAITGLAEASDAPVAGKPDGLYVYKAADGQYKDLLCGSLKGAAHPDNGKGMATWMKYALYPLHDGRLLATDGFQVYDWSPMKNANPSRDTPLGYRLKCFVSAGPEGFYAAQDIWGYKTQQAGIRVYWYDLSLDTYNNLTTNLTDGKRNTTGTVGPVNTGDYFYVGADVPFYGFYMETSVSGSITVGLRYYNGTWTVISAPSTYNGTRAFAIDGAYWTSASLADWQPTAVNGVTKYWMRVDMAGSGEATIKELFIIPRRPPVGITAGNDYTGHDRANLLTHILYCRPRGADAEWHEIATVLTGSPVQRLELHGTAAGDSNAGLQLWLISVHSRTALLLGGRDTPQLTPFPQCQKSDTRIGVPFICFGGIDCSEADPDHAHKMKRLKELYIHIDNLDDSDTAEFFARWDENQAWWKLGQASAAPIRITVPVSDEQQGLICHIGMSLNDGAVESVPPILRLIRARFEVLELLGNVMQPPVATPEVA